MIYKIKTYLENEIKDIPLRYLLIKFIHLPLIGIILYLFPLESISAAPNDGSHKVLRIGVSSFPPSKADPHRSVSVYASYVWSPIFETLTTFKENGELVGEIADNWQQIEDNLWKFILKNNIFYSNGRKLTAKDIVKSLEYLKTSFGKTSTVARDLDMIDSAYTNNEYELIIKTYYPSVILPRAISALFIVEPETWRELGPEKFSLNPIGSGSFKVLSWREDKIIYETNTQSRKIPKVNKMEVIQIPDVTSRLQALITGAVDIAIGMSPEHIKIIQSIGGNIFNRKPIDVISITFVVEKNKPTNNLLVRKALNYAVNKEAITEILLAGYSKPASQGAVSGLLGYNSTLKPYPFNPGKARDLLRQAGYEEGFELDIEVVIGNNASDSAIYQMVAENLSDINIKVNFISIPIPQMTRIILQGQWRGDGFSQIFGSWPTFEPLRTIKLHSCLWPNPWYCDDKIMPKLNQALKSKTLNKRIQLTEEILAFYHNQATALLLHEIPLLDGIHPRVMNYNPNKAKINYESINLK